MALGKDFFETVGTEQDCHQHTSVESAYTEAPSARDVQDVWPERCVHVWHGM